MSVRPWSQCPMAYQQAALYESAKSAKKQYNIPRLGDSCLKRCAAAGSLAEMRSPDVIVAGIDLIVAVAVGGEIGGRAHGFAPDDIVRRVDDSVAIVVAYELGDQRERYIAGIVLDLPNK